MLTARGCSGTALFREWSNQILTVCNFGNTLAITIIFFLKMFLKVYVDCINVTKNRENFFCFYNNCIIIRNCKFPQSWKGYLSSAVNVLTNTPKISKFNKGDIFQLISAQSNQKIWQRGFHADFPSVWHPLTCWLPKDFVKPRFLESGLTKFWQYLISEIH